MCKTDKRLSHAKVGAVGEGSRSEALKQNQDPKATSVDPSAAAAAFKPSTLLHINCTIVASEP
jgi:hypothetical protein